MTFQRPAVHVYQELVSASVSTKSPFFELCLVGPSYQVVSENKGAGYSAGTAYVAKYTNLTSGNVVDQNSVILTLKNAYAKIWPTGATLTNAVTVDNTDATTKVVVPLADQATKKFTTAKVAVGDIVRISYTLEDVTTSYTSFVQSIDDDTTITLKRNLPTPDVTAVIAVSVERALGANLILNNALFTLTAEGVTQIAAASVTTPIDSVQQVVTQADFYFTYNALRSALSSDFITIATNADIIANLGIVDASNPLALAASIVLANAEVEFKVLPIITDDKAGYDAALDLLSTNIKVYCIVPLTQDKDVISAYATHCATMSAPLKSKWRIMYANLAMPTTKVVVELNEGVLSLGGAGGELIDATNYLKDIANGVFITNGCAVNDFVDIYTSGATPVYQYSLKVDEVFNDTVLAVLTNKYTKGAEGYSLADPAATKISAADETFNYEICRVLSTAGLAEEMVSIASSFSNKRLRLVEPDTCMVNINDVDYILPGYYLCAAYGAMRASLPPHQGFTTISVSGIKRIFRSNKYFKDTQLDEMAGGGIFWVVQDEVEALPYCVYQTTTDITQLETIEDSIVATIDYCSMYYRDNLKPVIGKFNVNTISTKYVASVINDITDKLLRTSYPYIGSVLTSGSLKSITTSADKITPIVTITVPFPVNAVDLYLEV